MASSEDFQSIYELYKKEGIPNLLMDGNKNYDDLVPMSMAV